MIRQDKEKVKCYCEVCDEYIIGASCWMKHVYTNEHANNAFKEIMDHKEELGL